MASFQCPISLPLSKSFFRIRAEVPVSHYLLFGLEASQTEDENWFGVNIPRDIKSCENSV